MNKTPSPETIRKDRVSTKLTFAIGDIHGNYKLLMRAVEAITAYCIDHHITKYKKYTIVTLGDYVDRGSQSKAVLDFLMNAQNDFSHFTWVSLAGNHEKMFSENVHKQLPFHIVNENGFQKTLLSFGIKEGSFDARDIPVKYIEWIDSLPLYYEDKHRVFVHAYVCDGRPLPDHSEDSLVWNYYDEDDPGGWNGKFVVHGHIAHPTGPKIYGKRINLDTLAWKTNRLPVAVFDDDIPGGPIDIINVTLEKQAA